MGMYTVGQLGKRAGLSRSALLYYDGIGLLSPSMRSACGYRLYSEGDVRRLERIMLYREAGLPLDAIASLLQADETSASTVLERHLHSVSAAIARLRQQQHVIAKLLGDGHVLRESRSMNKEQWIALLASTGLDEAGMDRWHMEFEKMSPAAHQDFLESLGIPPEEVALIRYFSRQGVADPGT